MDSDRFTFSDLTQVSSCQPEIQGLRRGGENRCEMLNLKMVCGEKHAGRWHRPLWLSHDTATLLNSK